MLDKIDHVVQGILHILFLCDLFPRLENGLYNFRTSTSAGPPNPDTSPSMVRAQLPTANIEYGIAKWPAQRCLHDIDRCRNREWRILSLQKIDQRFSLGRHLLAQVIESFIPVEPDWIIVRAGHTTPDLPF